MLWNLPFSRPRTQQDFLPACPGLGAGRKQKAEGRELVAQTVPLCWIGDFSIVVGIRV